MKILKTILVALLIAQSSMLFFAFLLGGVVGYFYEYLDIIFVSSDIHYSSEDISRSLYFAICLFTIIFFSNRKSKKRRRIEDIIKKNYEKINLVYLFILNVVFFCLYFLVILF